MIEISGVTKSYGNGVKTEVLKGIDLTVSDGVSVILGASGSGKSTLLNIIGGLERADSGKVLYNGEDICAYSEKELLSFRRDWVRIS